MEEQDRNSYKGFLPKSRCLGLQTTPENMTWTQNLVIKNDLKNLLEPVTRLSFILRLWLS